MLSFVERGNLDALSIRVIKEEAVNQLAAEKAQYVSEVVDLLVVKSEIFATESLTSSPFYLKFL